MRVVVPVKPREREILMVVVDAVKSAVVPAETADCADVFMCAGTFIQLMRRFLGRLRSQSRVTGLCSWVMTILRQNWSVRTLELLIYRAKQIIPGLFDNYLHFSSYGTQLSLPLIYYQIKRGDFQFNYGSHQEFRARLWFTASVGITASGEPTELPHKEELDAISSDNPVVLFRSDGHCVWLNSCALAIFEITETTPDLLRAVILRDAHGEATGILLDTAIHLITDKLPVFPDEDKLEMW